MKKTAVLFFACAALALAAAPLKIVENGKSDYCIVINPASPKNNLIFAAKDLRTYIRKATGADLPIVAPDQRKDRPAFLLGFDPITECEAFTVRRDGRDIRISGNDTEGDALHCHWALGARTGTWFGVCSFLEKTLDIRWFFPGETGEYVPRTSVLAVDGLNYSERPKLRLRNIRQWALKDSTPKEREQISLFLRRNRVGKPGAVCYWHSWYRHLPGKKYFGKHPEWFALVGGRRLPMNAQGLQLCTTNMKALEQFADNLIAFNDKHFKQIQPMMPLTPNDGGGFCECPRCTALDDGKRRDGSVIMTTRMMTYANNMARIIRKKRPDQLLGMDAYSYYAEAVGNVKLDPNIHIFEYQNDSGLSYYLPAHRAEHLRNLKAWKTRAGHVTCCTFPEGMGNLEMPCAQFSLIKMYYRNIYDAQLDGVSISQTTSISAAALNLYFYARFAWEGIERADAVYADALGKCYGAAAYDAVDKYFKAVEQCNREIVKRPLNENRGAGFIIRYPEVFEVGYPALAANHLKNLRDALARTRDAGQKARLQLLIDNLVYADKTIRLYNIGRQLTSGRQVSEKQIQQAMLLCDERDTLVRKMRPLPGLMPNPAAQAAKFHLPLDRNIFKCALRKNLTRKAFLKIVKTIDWEKIPALAVDLNPVDVSVAKVKAQVKMAVQDERIHFRVRCDEPRMDAVRDTLKGRVKDIWQDNTFEIFIEPRRNHPYFQMAFNAVGGYSVFRYKKNEDGYMPTGEWNSDVKLRTRKAADFWELEISVPVKDFTGGDAEDAIGSIWRMNFCRSRKTEKQGQLTVWCPTFGSFHNVGNYGKVIIQK